MSEGVVNRLTALLLVVLTAYYYVEYLSDRYRIMIDDQVLACFPFKVYLVDLHQRDIDVGQIAVFSAKGAEPYIADGQNIGKMVVARDGQTVNIDEIQVEGPQFTVKNMPLFAITQKTGRDPLDFIGTRTVPENELFVMGNLPQSYDSRFWGTVKPEQVVGRGYVLF